MNRTYAGTLRKEHVGQKITLAGWVAKQRDFGELVFVDLRDRTGIVQVVADQKFVAADVVAAAKELRTEFVVRIDGEVKERDAAQKNSKLPTGDVEVVASKIEILNRADTPPFPIDDEADAAEELRLKYRVLDLRRPTLARNLILRHNGVDVGKRDFLGDLT